jgi:UDPglucose 6-dehydrogenase
LEAEVFRTGVVGVGYVGLATAACLSHLGHSVLCVDKDEERTRALEKGRVPFYEPGLEELVPRGIHAERLSFAGPDGLPRLVGETDVVL